MVIVSQGAGRSALPPPSSGGRAAAAPDDLKIARLRRSASAGVVGGSSGPWSHVVICLVESNHVRFGGRNHG